tara:strand:+ start:1528 stop:2853 length:1326 start_codon:yes stop_codon:yes gene_type:complete
MSKATNWLTFLIVLSMLLGVLFGEFILFDPDAPIDGAHWTKSVGDLVLIRPLKMLVIPLIFLSVIAGITRIGDPSKLGKLGISTLAYYLGTMLIAVVIGATLVSYFQPGHLDADVAMTLQQDGQAIFDANETKKAQIEDMQKESLGSTWMNILRQCIPTNVFKEMVETRPLGIIVFALGLGLALAAGGQRTEPARRFFNAAFEGMMIFVQWVIWLTPVGVFFLMAWTVGTIGFATMVGPLGSYIGVVLLGLLIHGAVVLPLLLWLLSGTNPYRFMWQMRRALLTAFGTDSSSATLPVTMDCAEGEGGCSKRASNFVLPLGSTVNMDGTALYEAVAVVFLFQLFGFELAFGELVVVVITATLAAIGAAGIPSAGLVTMVIVIAAVNSSLQGTGQELPLAAIGVILGVDRIVDMCRTTVNVWGDATAAKVMTRLAPDEPAATD